MKIGFIDHHLNNYHSDVFHQILGSPASAGVAHLVSAYESHPEGPDWCEAKGVARASSPEEVIAKSDAIMVLAPDNVEMHLDLARAAIESKKPVYIDKNLARSLADAKEIVALAAKHGTPIMSSSALWFAAELEEMLAGINDSIESAFARGFGKWRGYSIHTISPAIRLFGAGVKRVIDTGTGSTRYVTLDDGRRRATIEVRESENQYEATPWQFGALVGGRYEVATVKKFNEFYENLLKHVLTFFKTHKSPVSLDEQLMIIAVENAADESLAKGGSWVDVGIR